MTREELRQIFDNVEAELKLENMADQIGEEIKAELGYKKNSLALAVIVPTVVIKTMDYNREVLFRVLSKVLTDE